MKILILLIALMLPSIGDSEETHSLEHYRIMADTTGTWEREQVIKQRKQIAQILKELKEIKKQTANSDTMPPEWIWQAKMLKELREIKELLKELQESRYERIYPMLPVFPNPEGNYLLYDDLIPRYYWGHIDSLMIPIGGER